MLALEKAIIAAGNELQDEHDWFMGNNGEKEFAFFSDHIFVRVLTKHLSRTLSVAAMQELVDAQKQKLRNEIAYLQIELEELETKIF